MFISSDYGRVLKQFYKWLRCTKQAPDEVSWIKTKLSHRDLKPKGDLITWEDIRLLSEVSDNPKDCAFINFLYESGARIGEILNMKTGDIQFNDRYARVRFLIFSKSDLL